MEALIGLRAAALGRERGPAPPAPGRPARRPRLRELVAARSGCRRRAGSATPGSTAARRPYLAEFAPGGVELGVRGVPAVPAAGLCPRGGRRPHPVGERISRGRAVRGLRRPVQPRVPRVLASLGFVRVGGHEDEVDGYEDVMLLAGDALSRLLSGDVPTAAAEPTGAGPGRPNKDADDAARLTTGSGCCTAPTRPRACTSATVRVACSGIATWPSRAGPTPPFPGPAACPWAARATRACWSMRNWPAPSARRPPRRSGSGGACPRASPGVAEGPRRRADGQPRQPEAHPGGVGERRRSPTRG